MKERFTNIVASSLGDYFGVGFNSPEDRLAIDFGKMEQEFDEDAQERLNLGNCMENACLDYFEQKLGTIIDERNSEYKYACDGQLKCKRDGRTFLNGVETGVENKYSNSKSYCFTDNVGYQLQCQAYMMAWELDQWLLCGMHQGKPVMKLIKKDEEIQKDIETMVSTVVGILMGLIPEEDYPWDIVDKYSKSKPTKTLTDEDLEDYDKELLHRIGELNEEKKAIEAELEELTDYAKRHYTDSKWSDDDYKYTVSTRTRKGAFDEDRLSIEHPDIDVYSYRKPSSEYVVVSVTKKK